MISRKRQCDRARRSLGYHIELACPHPGSEDPPRLDGIPKQNLRAVPGVTDQDAPRNFRGFYTITIWHTMARLTPSRALRVQ